MASLKTINLKLYGIMNFAISENIFEIFSSADMRSNNTTRVSGTAAIRPKIIGRSLPVFSGSDLNDFKAFVSASN